MFLLSCCCFFWWGGLYNLVRELPVNSTQNDPRLFAFPSGEVPPPFFMPPKTQMRKERSLEIIQPWRAGESTKFSHIRADGSKKTPEKLGMVNSSHLKNDGNPEIMGIFQTPTELGWWVYTLLDGNHGSWSTPAQKKGNHPWSHHGNVNEKLISFWISYFLPASWWFQPIWKILVKLDHFPR